MIKRLLFLGISVAYFGLTVVTGKRRGASRVVLTYHGVHHDDRAMFERQMRNLKRRATPVFADDPDVHRRPSVAVTFDDALQSVFDQALPVLSTYDIPATIFVPTGYLGGKPGWMTGRHNSNGASESVVGADALKRVDRRLVRVGSHTVSHPRLAAVDETQLEVELAESKAALEAITGDRIRMLALPYGSYAPNVVAAARRHGYDCIFSNVPARSRRPMTLRLVGRVDVSPRDWPLEFRLKVDGAYEWMAVAVPMKRAILRLLKSGEHF